MYKLLRLPSSVLQSKRAIEVNIAIMRAFVRVREVPSTYKELERKPSKLERRIEDHDESIQTIFEAIRQLMTPPEKPRKIYPVKLGVGCMLNVKRV